MRDGWEAVLMAGQLIGALGTQRGRQAGRRHGPTVACGGVESWAQPFASVSRRLLRAAVCSLPARLREITPVSVLAWRDALIARRPQPLGRDAIGVTAR